MDGNTYTVYPYRAVPSVAMNMKVAQMLQAGTLVNNADLSLATGDGSESMITLGSAFGIAGIDFSSGGNVNPQRVPDQRLRLSVGVRPPPPPMNGSPTSSWRPARSLHGRGCLVSNYLAGVGIPH